MATSVEAADIPAADQIDVDDARRQRAQALAASVSQLPDGYYTSVRVLSTLVALSISLVATYFAFEASAAAVGNINADIGPSPNASLLSTVWTVGQALSILLMGRLTDTFGRRSFVIGTNLIGLVGGIIACTAPTFNTLIGGQVLLGIASSQSGSYLLLIGELMSNKTKFLGTVIVAAPNVIATGFGPYIGESLGHQGKWRWIFYSYLIMQVLSTAILWIFYYPPSFIQLHGKTTSKREELKKLDWVGMFLLTAGMSLFLLGISWGGSPLPWNSARIIGLLVSGGFSLVAFVLYECFGNVRRPVIPMKLFRDVRGFTCLVAIAGVFGVLNVALFIMYPQQVTHIFGSSLTRWEDTAWMSSTAAFSIWAGIIIMGSLFAIIRHIKWQLIFGAVWTTAFLGAMASVTENTKASAIVFSIFTGFFIGWGEDVAMLLVQFISTDQDLGVAYSVVSASRAFFGSIFTAAFITLYMNKLPGELQKKLVPAVLSAGLPESSIPSLLTAVEGGSQQAIAAVPGMTVSLISLTNTEVSKSYSASYAYVYYFAVALGCVAIFACASLRDFDRYLTDHVPRQLYSKEESAIDPLAIRLVDSTASANNDTWAHVHEKETEKV